MRRIELLAPARDAETAREAILHGADAVYIGAPKFGARAAAGNSVDDIRRLVGFAHIYGVKVYVTLNTILYDDELEDVRQLANELVEAGVDAFIVQDMAFVEMDILPISLHASTQMDNRTADKVRWLRSLGFEQVVLARELTLDEIGSIHKAVPDVALEVFVHGATCVSYNGQCYASQYCFGRSANRGECAQFCRLPFDLVDAEGNPVRMASSSSPSLKKGDLVVGRHLLSLRDMNRSAEIEDLLDAGVSSFKIEGRLKDVSYVKNVTAYYRKCIDEVIRRRPSEFQRSSVGVSSVDFTPNPDRSFNRGFSDYFLHGRRQNMVQLCSPKSTGQYAGHVKEIRRNCFTVSSTLAFSNGDGLCFVDANGNLQGFRVNRVEGNCLYPKEMPKGLAPRMPLYRNFDQAFLQQLSHPTAQRRISVRWVLSDEAFDFVPPRAEENAEANIIQTENAEAKGITLRVVCEDGVEVSAQFPVELTPARTPQTDNIARQLSRLGDTSFVSEGVEVHFAQDWFIPSSTLADWRRQVIEKLVDARIKQHQKPVANNKVQGVSDKGVPSDVSAASKSGLPESLSYSANVANRLAREFYRKQGVSHIDSAFELGTPSSHQPFMSDASSQQPLVLMTLKYCPRYELGLCLKDGNGSAGPLYLRSMDGKVFPLRFDCKRCQVQVLSSSPQSGSIAGK